LYRRRLEIDSQAGVSWGALARALFSQGKFDEAWETLEKWKAMLPDHPSIPLYPAQFTSAQGDYDAAEAYLETWRELRRGHLLDRARIDRLTGRLALVQGQLGEAESYFRDAMAVYEERGRSTEYLLAGIELAGPRSWFLGDADGALEIVETALEKHPLDPIEPLERPYAGLSGFYAFAGVPERAQELLAEWEAVIPPEIRPRLEVERRFAWGAVALAEGRADDALDNFRYVQERVAYCPICGLPLLGQVYELAGEPDSAIAIYERYLTTPYYGRAFGTPPFVGY
jgi:tetratricopeptide (TPR) repeat protein